MKTINIIGLGLSNQRYEVDNNISIGVNDSLKYFETDYLVCVDLPKKFNSNRLKYIVNNKAQLYTHLNDWNSYRSNNTIIKLAKGRGSLKELDSDSFCYSNNSTYVATILAYKLGAKEINLYGVDFNNHSNIKDTIKDQAIKHFVELSEALDLRSIKLRTTKESSLSAYLESF